MKYDAQPTTGVDLDGKILVIKSSSLAKQYDTFDNHFYRATGGFGCSPSCIGKALFTENLFDHSKERWSRGDFEGWLTDEQFDQLCKDNEWEILTKESASC